jgi:hypothetical protein
MEAASTAETSVLINQYARRHIVEGCNQHTHPTAQLQLSAYQGQQEGQRTVLSLIRCPHCPPLMPAYYRILTSGAIHFGKIRTNLHGITSNNKTAFTITPR